MQNPYHDFCFFVFVKRKGRKRNSPTNKNWPKNRNRRGSCIKRDNGHRIEDENKPEVVRERERERKMEGWDWVWGSEETEKLTADLFEKLSKKSSLSLSLKTREVCCEVRNDTASFWENIGSGCGWGRVAFAFYFCACKRKTWSLRLWHFRIFLFFKKKN